ncbi:Transcriptional regulator SlyA [Brevundimonas subvibrioides]|uniref:MarR family winged helix-turn-helix transcriptional regulator n=1 Tax=Brevundimonas subvibrioides TaxID=74313 RepID=UPI0032D5A4CD
MTDPRAPTDWTGYLLNTVATQVREATAAALSPWSIGPRDLGALTALAAGPGLSQIALGRRIGMDRTSIVQLADRLEAAGWIERRVDPSDRRVNLLGLSTEGTQRLDDASRAARNAETACLSALSPDEIRTLRALLERTIAGDAAG